MKGLEEIHNNMIFYSVILLFTVTWVLITIIINYDKYYISNKYINHNILNLMLTRAPVLILIVFTLFILYLID
jgi:heme/copper-type cytochrome/quinol oxidase subunit 2